MDIGKILNHITIQSMANSPIIRILLLTIVLDVFLGSIRAWKEHKWNSTVGINGMLRKIAMIGCIFFLGIFDRILNLNLLFMVPDEVLNFIKLERVATCELFGLLYILYEFTSVLKNMVLCGLPIPKKMKEKLESFLQSMTTELDGKLEDKKEGE